MHINHNFSPVCTLTESQIIQVNELKITHSKNINGLSMDTNETEQKYIKLII